MGNTENVIRYRAFLVLVSGDRLYVFCISEVNFRENLFIKFCVSIFGILVSCGTVSTSFHLSLY
jgi:hypothetical protein